MSDLISRKALLEDMRNSITENSDTFDWINLINRQSTAYDLDKVIERLEDKIEITWSHDYLGGRQDAFNEAIDIVKGGGMDE